MLCSTHNEDCKIIVFGIQCFCFKITDAYSEFDLNFNYRKLLYGMLVRYVALLYLGKKQFHIINYNELKTCKEEWIKLEQKEIQGLYKSLPERIIEVLENKGENY